MNDWSRGVPERAVAATSGAAALRLKQKAKKQQMCLIIGRSKKGAQTARCELGMMRCVHRQPLNVKSRVEAARENVKRRKGWGMGGLVGR